MKHITIGTLDDNKPLVVNVETLIQSKALVQANSGGGKSNTIRLLAEKLSPIVPCIIIDPEGEFATLREKVDLVLVGDGGELAATPKNAGEVALKLLDLRVSAVIDLYGLGKPAEKREWVRRYCENIIAAPRRLWRPFVLFIDEAQEFAPEKAEASSHGPLIEVMTKARKRDMCPILVTPRLAMLDADARGPINNFLIGRATLDIDYKRAGEILGMPPAERRSLASLKQGNFHTFGPTFAHDGVRLAHLDKATTRPAKTGTASTSVPAPSAAIKAVVHELEALAQPADPDDVSTIEAAHKRIKELKGELRQAKHQTPPAPTADPKAIKRAVAKATADLERHWQGEIRKFQSAITARDTRLTKIGKAAVDIAAMAHLNGEAKAPEVVKMKAAAVPLAGSYPESTTHKSAPIVKQPRREPTDGSSLPQGEAKILAALIQYPNGLRREQLTIITGYKRSTRDAYIQRLRERGYCDQSGERIVATDAGVAALPNAEPLPIGQDLQDYWLAKLPEGEAAILRVLIEAYPDAVDREALTESTGYKRSTRDAYLQRLAGKELVDAGRGEVAAAAQLFEGAPA